MTNDKWKMENLIFHMSFDIFHLPFKKQSALRPGTPAPASCTCTCTCLLHLLPCACLLSPASRRYCVLLTDAGEIVNVISVRRFFALPLRVVFADRGFAAPMPLAWTREASTPAACKRFDSWRARSCVSCCSVTSSPLLSV
jgi:hypothetical protein